MHSAAAQAGPAAPTYDAELATSLAPKRSWSLRARQMGPMGGAAAEYHKFYGSAALMMVNEVHHKIQKK